MSDIRYYHLANGEELPDEFCAVRDVDGEPSEYTFYVPEAENAKLHNECDRMYKANVEKNGEILRLLEENAKLKEERDHWRVEQVHAYGNWEDAHKRATELEAENAKLRELCARMFKDFVSCDYELRARAGRTFMAFTRYALELQELGIEVDK